FVEADVILWRGRSSVSDKARNGTNILAAVCIAMILWWLFALWSRRSTTAATVNAGVYGELCEQLTDLSARIPENPPCPRDVATAAAYRQAVAHREVIAAELGSTDGALRWITGTGYTNVWKSVHRLQEALIIFDTQEEVIAGALRDEWRLKGSAIEQVDEVLTTLRYALTGFGLPPVPGMVPPLPPPSPEQARALRGKVHDVIAESRDTR